MFGRYGRYGGLEGVAGVRGVAGVSRANSCSSSNSDTELDVELREADRLRFAADTMFFSSCFRLLLARSGMMLKMDRKLGNFNASCFN